MKSKETYAVPYIGNTDDRVENRGGTTRKEERNGKQSNS